VTELRAGIDPLQADLLQSGTPGRHVQCLTQSDDASGGALNRSLEENKILLDLTVVNETTHGGDGFLGKIELSGAIVVHLLAAFGTHTLANSEDLLVDLSSVVVTLLTSAGNCPGDTGRMPGSNTSNLAETLVCLAGQFLDSPTGHNTLETITLVHTNGVNELVYSKDTIDCDGALEQANSEVDLVLNGTTVDLDLSNVGLLLESNLAGLGLDKEADNLAVLLDGGNVSVDGCLVLNILLGVVGESLLLGSVPSLVEATEYLLAQVLGPHSAKSANAVGSLNVTNNTNGDQGGSLNDGSRLKNFTLVHLGSELVQVTYNVGHTSLVSKESSQVGRLGLVVLGESPYSAPVGLRPFLGEESKIAVPRCFELPVRHLCL